MADNEMVSANLQGPSEWRPRVIAVTAIMTSLGTLAVALRVFTRSIWIRNFGLDDVVLCIGWLFAMGYTVEVILAVKYFGIGYSVAIVRPDQFIDTLKVTVAIQATYYGIVTFVKVSILCFYLRIAASRFLVLASRATIGFLFTFFVVCIIVVFTQCIPLRKSWDITNTVQGSCVNTTSFFYTTSGMHILIDIWIILLPMKSLVRIQREKKEKIALFCIFGVGIFSLVCGVIRLYSIRVYTLSKDPTKDAIPVNFWSLLECYVGIICACVPALKPLFLGVRRPPGATTTGGSNHTYANRWNKQETGHSDSKDSKNSKDSYNMKSFSSVVNTIGPNSKGSLNRPGDSTENIVTPDQAPYSSLEAGKY